MQLHLQVNIFLSHELQRLPLSEVKFDELSSSIAASENEFSPYFSFSIQDEIVTMNINFSQKKTPTTLEAKESFERQSDFNLNLHNEEGSCNYGLCELLQSMLFDRRDAPLKTFDISDEDLELLKGLLLGRLYSGRNKKVYNDLYKLNKDNFLHICSEYRGELGHQRMNILKRSLFPRFCKALEHKEGCSLMKFRPKDNVYSNTVINKYFTKSTLRKSFIDLCKDNDFLQRILDENRKIFTEGFFKWRQSAIEKLQRKIKIQKVWSKIHLPISRNCLNKFVQAFLK